MSELPLAGVKVLALEQMQALPYATQLLARLGADVLKVEPIRGESGRASLPAMVDPAGRSVGATFLRNNLNKRSVAIDLKNPKGRELVLAMAPNFDVFAENFRSGALARMGLGYDDVAAVNPAAIYLSVSGFGNQIPSPYESWPAYAAIVEAMSGIYDYRFGDDEPPASPTGALGDISSAMFGIIGVLAALRHRDRTGEGQWVDVAMLDAVVSMTDIVMNMSSLGVARGESLRNGIVRAFRAADGWFVMQVVREHQFERFAELVDHPEWVGDDRFATRRDWADRIADTVRPAVESWASAMTRLEACAALSDAGIAAGPCFRDDEISVDPHVVSHNMVVEMDRPSGEGKPVLIPGNPIKMSKMAEGPETRVPWLGEHTDDVLSTELGLDAGALDELRAEGVIG